MDEFNFADLTAYFWALMEDVPSIRSLRTPLTHTPGIQATAAGLRNYDPLSSIPQPPNPNCQFAGPIKSGLASKDFKT